MTRQPTSKVNVVATIQRIQDELGALQMSYRDHQPEFWALRLAWEAVRFAWYVVNSQSDEKLASVETALCDFQDFARKIR